MELTASDLNKVLEVITAFNSEKDYLDLLEVILNKMMEMTNADAGTLYVADDDKLHFRIMRTVSMNVFQGARDEIGLPPVSLDKANIENVSAYAAIRNEIVYVDDVYGDARFNFAGPKNYDKMTGYHTQSMLVFPLTATTGETAEVIGVIQLINATDRESGRVIPFTSVFDRTILQALSNVSANALANVLYAGEIEELFDSFVRVMTQAIDERSVYNVNHTKNVARYCDGFARYLSEKFPKGHELHFGENRREQLVKAAFLHDIGKIITPLSIMDKMDRLGDRAEGVRYRFEIKKYQLENEFLRNEITAGQYEADKAGLAEALALIESSNAAGFLPDDKLERIRRLSGITYTDPDGSTVPVLTEENITALTVQKGTLTDDERRIMQEHVSITGRLLDNMKFNKYYKDVPKWARSHHEFLDGTGYPLGLSGDDVTTEVCILSIMDIYDALTAADRPYKKAVPIDKVREILTSMAAEGKLHAELVRLFLESGIAT